MMNAWDTLRDLLSIRERMNKLFEDSLGRGEVGGDVGAVTWSPVVDMYETESEFTVEAELPEVKESEVDIRLESDTLIMEGERKPGSTRKERYYMVERAYGRFSRSFPLPASVDMDAITATLKDGILRVILPKKAGETPKQITIVEGR